MYRRVLCRLHGAKAFTFYAMLCLSFIEVDESRVVILPYKINRANISQHIKLTIKVRSVTSASPHENNISW